jgi:putative lipoic acid-binding regulatory protein
MNTDIPGDHNMTKDGFDSLKYPCEYLFKAVCRVDKSSSQTTQEAIHSLVLKHIEASRIISVYNNQSKTGKFESISVNVRLLDRAELETIYTAICESPLVVMTL